MIAVLAFIIAFGVWFTRSMLLHDIILWSDISVQAAMTSAVVGPLCAALSAWLAGQDERRRMEDQLASTPRPQVQQDAQTLLSGAIIGLLGYGGVLVVILVWGATQATWGRPYGLVLFSGLPWVILMAVLGAMLGSLWSNRFAPMAALVTTGAVPLFQAAMSIPSYQIDVPGHFFLWTVLTDGQYWVSEWKTVRTIPSLIPNMLLGLGLVGVVASAFLRRRTRTQPVHALGVVSVGGSFVAALVIAQGVGTPLSYPPNLDPRPASGFAYTCRIGSYVEVCMHPGYAGALDDALAVADLYYEPIAGLPGVPTSIWQVDLNDHTMNEVTTFSVQNTGYEGLQISYDLQHQLLPLSTYSPGETQDGQVVIGEWLIQRATGSGRLSHRMYDQHGNEMTDPHRQELVAAVDRFAALSQEEQRAWLEANWDALLDGEIVLEDLP